MTTALHTRPLGPWWARDDREHALANLDESVRARAARRRFGASFWLELYPANPEHRPVVRHWPPPPSMQTPALPALSFLVSANQGDRTEAVSGVILHETEGAYLGAVSWLRNPAAQASAHLVLREDGAHATQLVPWSRKAWHAAQANSHTLGIEISGKTAGAGSINAAAQVAAAVRIVAYWCHLYGIPARGATDQGYNGITTHRALGAYGGGHHDPGGFDVERFIHAVARQVDLAHFPTHWGTA